MSGFRGGKGVSSLMVRRGESIGGRSPNTPGKEREEEMALLFGEDDEERRDNGDREQEDEYHGPFRGLQGQSIKYAQMHPPRAPQKSIGQRGMSSR